MTFATALPRLIHWQAEGLRFYRQPLTWWALGALLWVLLASATVAGLEARAWRHATEHDESAYAEKLQNHVQRLEANSKPGPANANATYQMGRSELGLTRMPVEAGLALGVGRLQALLARVKVSLDTRHVDSRDPGPLYNPLLTDAGLPGLPAMAALLIPLVALVLCAGLLQEEREQGRLGLLQVQSRRGVGPVVLAALGWRLLALWAVAVVATVPALMLDPGADMAVALQWTAALGLFCAVWVALGGVLSCLPISSAASLLAALGLWLALTFAVPAGLALHAQKATPMPSRLAFIVALRAAQHQAEDNEQALAEAWYDEHPHVPAHLPAAWPASFVVRVLHQDEELEPIALQFREARVQQARQVSAWAWLSPGLALVLFGERLAGTDADSYERYLAQVDAFEQRWRAFWIPHVMSRLGVQVHELRALPRFRGIQASPG
jgi:ABC-2 type transport system permease protein